MRVSTILFGLGLCSIILASTKPQMNEVVRLEKELVEVEKQEKDIFLEKDRVEQQRQALRSNPEYLEMIARDKLDLQKEGETVIRIQR